MTTEQILSNLCLYDERNPDGLKSYMDEDDYKYLQAARKNRKDCFCDNCFYGRTVMAEYILELQGQTK